MTEEVKAQRVHVSNVSLTFFETTQLNVDVLTVKTAGEKFTTVCPDCEETHKVNRMYVCSENEAHGPYFQGAKAKEVDGVLHRLTEQEVEEVSGPLLDKNEAEVSVFHADALNTHTRPSDSAYRLRPHGDKKRPASKATKAAYSTIVAVLKANPDKAFVFDLNLKGYQSMYRLEVWNGQLVAQKLLRPEELAAVDAIEEATSERFVQMLSEYAERDVQEFDPAEWQNKVREGHRRIAAQKAGASEAAPIKKSKPKAEEFSIEDLMAQIASERQTIESKKDAA